MAVNNFLPFCPSDIGTNLLTQIEYAAAANRTDGNQPGIASSKLNNKALRQANYIASQLAQYLANTTGLDFLDNGNASQLLAQISAGMDLIPPRIISILSGSGTYNRSYIFYIEAGNATSGATYTNNGATFVVQNTITGALKLSTLATTGVPLSSGTLTKASGTGDATITFYAVRTSIYYEVEMVGGGGGGSSGDASGSAGGAGGQSSFGTSLLTADGGGGGGSGGTPGAGVAGGPASLGTGPSGVALQGGAGTGAASNANGGSGGGGAATRFGGAGGGGISGQAGWAAIANTGSGGGGGGGNGSHIGGGGGGAGGYVKAQIPAANLASGMPYVVGAAGTNGGNGGNGSSGIIIVTEVFQ